MFSKACRVPLNLRDVLLNPSKSVAIFWGFEFDDTQVGIFWLLVSPKQAAVDSWEAETGEAWPYRQRADAEPLVTHPDIRQAVKLKRLL
jgi:hypothetical protein